MLLCTPAARHARGTVAAGVIVVRGAVPSRRCVERVRALTPCRKLAHECTYGAVLLTVFYLQGAHTAQLQHGALVAESTLLLGAAPIGSAARAAAAEIDDFAFFARTCDALNPSTATVTLLLLLYHLDTTRRPTRPATSSCEGNAPT
jgi:hypothetical protein